MIQYQVKTMHESNEKTTSANEYPEAELRSKRTPGEIGGIVISRLWLVTALCFVLAAVPVFLQLCAKGPQIEVCFSTGHGL